ncbi:ferritin-like protein [Streptomyces sp. J2-1]|uniref:ferritin-like domain-containing protein n=1 Tax=Streptomyces corallincola TaxID=2851888 RepID=UPI001C384E97|nr:ferritin-like protein [Streptomyces corallincola]MBV2356701.1 ferritin-like protein [Streptomyces corallincola]
MAWSNGSSEEASGDSVRRRSLLASAALAAGAPLALTACSPGEGQRGTPARPAPPLGAVARLVAVPERDRDTDWLRAALQVAVEIEFATIPPYLCGWWSVRNRKSDAARLIRRIVSDEMYHLGVVCNLLVGLGGRPRVRESAPVYPGPLPGGVHPGVEVYLSGLTKGLVRDVMMAIEAPAVPLTDSAPDRLSIGHFYDEVLAAFRAVAPDLSVERQLRERIGEDTLRPVRTLEDVERSIEIIKDQGEGTSLAPDDGLGDGHVAHYYAFAEIHHGRRIRQSGGTWQFTGPPVPFPDTRPMSKVPAGGWDRPPAEVRRLLDDFDGTYTTVLEALDTAWAEGDPEALRTAVQRMRRLETPAVALMEIPIAGTAETYGPCFRVRPDRLP